MRVTLGAVIFETLQSGGCLSYLVGCEATSQAIAIDPQQPQQGRLLGLVAARGLRLHYALDTHTHADHFSATRALAERLGIPSVMHRLSPAPFVDLRVDDGETLIVGELRLRVLHTPGHTADSICLVMPDRVFTADTLLLGSCGRTDLPTGDPEQLHDSLFGKLLQLDGALTVYPGHNYKGTPSSTLAEQIASNPRLARRERAAFVEMMRSLSIEMPQHLTEALRTNSTGGKTVAQIIAEAAEQVAFVSMEELRRRVDAGRRDMAILDVREADAFAAGHVPGALHLPRGQLELRVDAVFPDPSVRIAVYCEFGKISTIAAATLRSMGFSHAVALDGGFRAWCEGGHPIEKA